MDANLLNWNEVTGGRTEQRLRLAQKMMNLLPPEELGRIRLEECADEKTGQRYGHANLRRGMAIKLGGGGRNKGNRWAYQIWLVWS